MLKSGVTVYYVRHGETDWNRAQRYQGRQDIPLNATGRAQAERNGMMLREVLGGASRTIDYVSSPLLRARETMEIARRCLGLAPDGYRHDERLAEIRYGHWEGHLWSELPSIDPEGFAARQADLWRWQPRDGESYQMLSERVAGWLAEVDRNSVVVAHGGVMRVLHVLVQAIPPAAIATLEVPQDRVLMIENNSVRWL